MTSGRAARAAEGGKRPLRQTTESKHVCNRLRRLRYTGAQGRPQWGQGPGDRRDRRHPGHRSRRYLRHAGRGAGRSEGAQAVRYRYAEGVRLVPAVPRGDRRPPRLSGLVHDHGRAGNEDPHPIRKTDRPAPRCVGSVHLRSSAGVRLLSRQRPLRAAGHGRGGRHHGNLVRQDRAHRGASPGPQGREQSLLCVQSGAVHRLLALRARLR